MTYDFTTLPDRWDDHAEKYEMMKRRCPDVPRGTVPFSVADMDFLPPPELAEGLSAYFTGHVLGYTLTANSYYQAFTDWMRRRHGLELEREWLLDADSVIGAMHQMIRAFTQPGDEIIVMTPAYPPFLAAPDLLNRRRVDCPLKMDAQRRYQLEPDRLEELCRSPRAKILLLSNPHNPVGRVWSRRELEDIAEICLRHQVFIISDEIHGDLIMPGYTCTSMATLPEKYLANCAVSTACTKTFNVAAIKGAVIIMQDAERRRLYAAQGTLPGRDILSYVAAELLYRKGEPWLEQLLGVLDGNRRLMEDFLRAKLPEVGITPLEGTYLQWLDFRFLKFSPQEQERFMGEKAHCFFTEGYRFGEDGAGFERWNLACPADVLLRGLERMEHAVRGRA